MPELDLRISITTGKSTDSRKPSVITLRVEDGESSSVLAHAEIEAWQWWDIVTGSCRTVSGFVSPNLDRVGKKLVTDLLHVPREVYEVPEVKKVAWKERGPVIEGLAEAWAYGLPDAADWPEISVRRTNSGWNLIRRRWEAATDG